MIVKDTWPHVLVASLVTGILYALSLDIFPFGALALIAPIPILLLALVGTRTRRVALAAFLARAIGCAGLIYAYGGTMPTPVMIVIVCLFSGLFTVVVLLTRWSAGQLSAALGVFTFPLFATALEFLLLLRAPDGTFGSMGYSLVSVLPLAQLASIGGVAALTFIVTLVPMSIAMLIERRDEWRRVSIAAAVPLLLAIAFGFWRLSQPYERSVRVGLAAIDELTMRAVKGPSEAAQVAQRYASLVQSFASDELDFIVLPERVLADRDGKISDGSMPLQSAANALGATLVAGFTETLADDKQANTARVFAPEGEMHGYTKRRLIPGLESGLVPGDRSLLLGDVGIAICKDMDFAPMIREYGREGATLMLVPAWDFIVDGRMHSRMAVLRSIENGFAMARAAAQGRLTVNDAYGRILAETITSETEPTTLIAEVGITSRARTLYSRIGDVFAWLAVVGAAVIVIAVATSTRGRARREAVVSGGG